MGIQLAPAPVGAVAYIAVGGGAPDVFVHALLGYGVLQLLVLARLSPWIARASAAPGLWAFSFGMTAIAAAPAYLAARGDGGAISVLSAPLFVVANIFVVCIVLMTLSLLITGKMFTSLQRTERRQNERAAGGTID